MFDDLNLKGNDKYFILLITLFSTALVAYYINFNVNLGIYCSDVYVYLLNALYYTGTNINSTNTIHLSPIICFLTSLLFRLGMTDKIAILIVTAIFAILGNIGLYVLLRQYFDEKLSLTGTIIYSTLSLNLTWLANGSLDIPAVSMTIWLVLFSILAIKENPKFYRYAFPMFVVGFFTRYTVVLTIPALLLYYVYEKGFKIDSKDFKYILQGILISIAITAIILHTIMPMGNGQFGASSQISDGISGKQGLEIDPAYNTDSGFYLLNFPNFISNSNTVLQGNPILNNPTPLSWAILALLFIGAIVWVKYSEIKLEKKNLIPAGLFAAALLTYTQISSMITILIVMLGLYLLGKDSKSKTGYMMAAWILANFIFFSYYNIKVNRYIIPTFPPLIYFIIRSVSLIHEHVKINANVIPIILIALFAIQGFAFTQTFEPTNDYIQTDEMSNYIININPDYKDVLIGTYNMRPYHWFLGGNVTGIESDDTKAIDESNVTYYISDVKLNNLTNYTEIKNIHKLYLYEKSV